MKLLIARIKIGCYFTISKIATILDDILSAIFGDHMINAYLLQICFRCFEKCLQIETD